MHKKKGLNYPFNAVTDLPVQLIEVETSGEIFGEGPGVGYTL